MDQSLHSVDSYRCSAYRISSLIINKIEKNTLRVHGVFVIHDAILLDVHPDDEVQLHELVREGIDLDEMGIFPLSMDIISRAQ